MPHIPVLTPFPHVMLLPPLLHTAMHQASKLAAVEEVRMELLSELYETSAELAERAKEADTSPPVFVGHVPQVGNGSSHGQDLWHPHGPTCMRLHLLSSCMLVHAQGVTYQV